MENDRKSKGDGSISGTQHELEHAPGVLSHNGVEYTSNDYKNAKAKVDGILLPVLVLYYFLSFLDRGNIGNAKVAGLTTDLRMSPNQYALALTVTFIPYILIEFPSNLYLKKLGPHRVLPTLVCLWGFVTCMQGFVTNYGGLLACRFLIGLFEGGLTPGSVLILSTFYKRSQLQKRIAFFFGMIQLAGAFSGLLAYGIVHGLEGAHGHRGWRYIFWIEGAMSVVLGIITAPLLPRRVDSSWWLTKPQTAALLAELEADGAEYVAEEKVSWKDSCSVWYNNPSTVVHIGQYIANGFFTFGLGYFASPIVSTLGTYDTVKTQLMTAPPYCVGFAAAVITSIISDRYRCRGLFAMLAGLFGIVGFALNLQSRVAKIRYVALFLQLTAGAIQTPTIAAWGVNNAASHGRRAAHIAGMFAASNTMGMISVWLFPSTDAPLYVVGSSIGMTAAVFMFLLPLLLLIILKRHNKQRDEALSTLGPDHVFPPGPLDDRDLRFRFSY